MLSVYTRNNPKQVKISETSENNDDNDIEIVANYMMLISSNVYLIKR